MDENNAMPPESSMPRGKSSCWIKAGILMVLSSGLGAGITFYGMILFVPQTQTLQEQEPKNNSVSRLEADIAKLNQQIKEILPLSVRTTELESQVELLTHQNKDLEASIKQLPALPQNQHMEVQFQEILEKTKHRLEKIEQDITAQNQAVQKSQQQNHVLSEIRTSLEKGIPLGSHFLALKKYTQDDPEISILIQTLEPFQDHTPPTIISIIDEFKALEPKVMLGSLPENANLWDRFKSHLSSLIVIQRRDLDSLSTFTPNQAVQVIHDCLAKGDAEGALAAFEKLDLPIRTIGSMWHENVRTYITLHETLKQIESDISPHIIEQKRED